VTVAGADDPESMEFVLSSLPPSLPSLPPSPSPLEPPVQPARPAVPTAADAKRYFRRDTALA